MLHSASPVPMLMALLDLLDKFNRLAPGLNADDMHDLAWPAVSGECSLLLLFGTIVAVILLTKGWGVDSIFIYMFLIREAIGDTRPHGRYHAFLPPH